MTGTVPAHLLWENPNITWENTAGCFATSNESIRAQAPISWGGTNASIEANLNAKYWTPVTSGCVDSALDSASVHPVENRAVWSAIGNVENALTIILGE